MISDDKLTKAECAALGREALIRNSSERRAEAIDLFQRGRTVQWIERALGVSERTVYRYLKGVNRGKRR